MSDTLILSQIHIYPVKSLGGLALSSAQVEPRGLQHDRRWMVVDQDGNFLTQRELPRMATISVAVEPSGLRLTAPGTAPQYVFPSPSGGQTSTVRVWRSVCEALPAGEDADKWLTDFLGVSCRLVYMPEEMRRSVNPDYTAGEGVVSFADGYPLMVIGEASLQDLNTRLEQPVPMNRFRPSLVVSGSLPFAEDDWTKVRIGSALFHAPKPCDRCAMTTIDQTRGEYTGKEPLQTLASYRLKDQKVLFGQFLIPETLGTISVGDAVEAV